MVSAEDITKYNSREDEDFNYGINAKIMEGSVQIPEDIVPDTDLILRMFIRGRIGELVKLKHFDVDANLFLSTTYPEVDLRPLYKYSKHPTIILESEQDIMELSDKCVTKAEEHGGVVECFPVELYVDPSLMFKHGLFPANYDGQNLRDYTEDDLLHIPRWTYKTIDEHHKYALRKCDSEYLMYVAPYLLYSNSKRPINNMSMFRGPTSMTLTNISEEWSLIPVTRYSDGMSRGLFYGNNDGNFCGTFYYKEPESTTYLAYKTKLVAFNKVDAYRKLGGTNVVDYVYPEGIYLLHKHIKGDIPHDLMMTRREIADVFNPGSDKDNNVEKIYAKELDIYGAEDYLDQPLCKMARDAGYDVVILTNMVGSYQVVTEVLDTRPRNVSYQSLVYE